MVGLSFCMMSIYMGSSSGACFSTWRRDGHVVRLALSEGSTGGTKFGIILRQTCLSNIASMSEKDSARLMIGGACISITRV